jgi:hypothetical protein
VFVELCAKRVEMRNDKYLRVQEGGSQMTPMRVFNKLLSSEVLYEKLLQRAEEQ